ncbi:MAG: DUF5615 family PIN-like protein [Verrucomicrobia bacterium]|nr:DUF5615 family PIN-like protein [Verrucomicrobiota bacterium]
MKVLTDEHLPREVAAALRQKWPSFDAVSIFDTSYRGLPDPPLLEILDADKRVLVTRDVNSVPRHAKARLAEGKTHGGIIQTASARRRAGADSAPDRSGGKARRGGLDLPLRLALNSKR